MIRHTILSVQNVVLRENIVGKNFFLRKIAFLLHLVEKLSVEILIYLIRCTSENWLRVGWRER